MIIDWKKISENIYNTLKEEVSQISWEKPTLWAILVWEDSASLRYIKQKRKWADFVWMDFELKQFELSVTQEQLLEFIAWWNQNKKMSGYIVQLPLPKHIDEQKIIHAILPEKDVDWFHPVNQWKVLIWDDTGFAPCTPFGVMWIFDELELNLSWKDVVVIWRSNIVWKPVTAMLINKWATVISCNSRTPDINKFTKTSDIVICATWVPWLLKLENINDKTIVIDVWFTVIDWKIFWDADFDDIHENGNLITPVPGWVWRLTVANLLKNTLKAYKLWNI